MVRFSVVMCYFILNPCSCNSLFQPKAFFQKQRMKIKSNNVDSPKGYNPDNMDLLTLFIVNQISSKKEQNSDGALMNTMQTLLYGLLIKS